MVSPYWLFMLVGFKKGHPTTKKREECSHIKTPDMGFKDSFHGTEICKTFSSDNGLFNRLLSRCHLGVSSSMCLITGRKSMMDEVDYI